MTSGRLGREWTEYYRAVQGRPPRALFLEMLDQFKAAGLDLAGAQAVDQQPEAIALVRERVPPEHAAHLQTLVAPFQDVEFPPSFLVFAGYSLPFCPPERFPDAWGRVTRAILPGGYFGGHLFGDRDGWVGAPDMTFFPRAGAEALFSQFELKTFREVDDVRPSALEGPKRWHVYEIIARKSGVMAEP